MFPFRSPKFHLTSVQMYYLISSIFSLNVMISNIISSKMVKLPFWNDFHIPAGLIIYPFTFICSDFITEIYGSEKSREMIRNAFGMSILSYIIFKLALALPSSNLETQSHFEAVFGLNGLLIFASLAGYLVCQTIDIELYAWIKNKTGHPHLWLRNNGSTLIAQLIDTIIVNVIYLKIGLGMGTSELLGIMVFSYLYKCTCSITLTPVFYALIFLFKKISLIKAQNLKISLKP